MLWLALLMLRLSIAVSLQIPLRDTQKSSSNEATTFKLSSIYHRGLDQQYRRHRRLDITASHDEVTALAQTYDIDMRHRGKVVSLKDRDYNAIKAYRDDFTSLDQGSLPMQNLHASADRWLERDISLPNITDKGTILTLAAMTSNAYTAVPHTGEWMDVDDDYNSTGSFGWEDDGIRGHVFANPDNSSVIIAYKGTSLTGATAHKDKKADNLMFSCCCGRISYLWRTVCDCYQDTYTCNMTCLEAELRSPKAYYSAALDIYHNVTHQYPKAEIWTIGHSLGGALASLVAQTYGLPAVTFQAPGEKLAAKRLGLPIVPKSASNETGSDAGFAKNIWAFGHTADPIYMGSCGGITSLCWSGGYAMETHCHSGLECIYDVVSDFGWRQGVNTHRILNVINDVILKYNTTPTAERSDECVDCFNWND
jgi:lipase ATG15